ncbi:CoA-transferase [Bacillus sp. 1P02SD]|uniref:CoA-transferase n=1 Tax=Bacillus sp. 1P02SD TaxID=3132264 RepID=UPI0039A3C65A
MINQDEIKFDLPLNEGKSKVMPLSEAIKKHVKPRMMIDIGYSYGRPNAAINEIVRQFDGKDPKFSIVTAGLVANQAALVSRGLVKKIIASFCGDNFPTPGPNPIFQRAYKNGQIEIENWSLLSLNQRLFAGAMGIPFVPTNSLKDSGMSANADFHELANPFDENHSVGIVKALRPDIVVVHGLMADENGNVILSPPYGEGLYGAMASKDGVIVTVEKIVSTNFIRKHAAHVKIPGYLVKSVSEVPFGAHPYGVFNPGIEGPSSYVEDNDFIVTVRNKAKNEMEFEDWVKEWILECKDHSQYLGKIGKEKLQVIKQGSLAESWREDLPQDFYNRVNKPEYTDEEMMVVVTARKIKEKMRENNYHTILAGVGFSNLASWLATSVLKEENFDVELMAEIGMFGYLPRPGEPFIFSNRNLPTCKMYSDVLTTLGIMVGGSNNPCLGAIGAGQIDKIGNINSTFTANGDFMVGSGGANDIASASQELVVTVKQSQHRFIEKVPYVTSPGRNIKTVVSTLGVFEKDDRSNELILTSYFYKKGETTEQSVQSIKNKCGWDLRVSPQLKIIEPPTIEELEMIRYFDPNRVFLK